MSRTTKQHIDALWDSMRAIYGAAAWEREHGAHDTGSRPGEPGIWARALSKYHPKQVFGAVGACEQAYPTRPPTLWQFRALCRQQPDPDKPLELPNPTTRADPERASQEFSKLNMGRPRRTPENIESGEWSEEDERNYQTHAMLLGLDADSLKRARDRYAAPGSPRCCPYPGCSRVGAISHSVGGGGPFWCCEHAR